jgi:Spy/CpxP family protein refolding chaperone
MRLAALVLTTVCLATPASAQDQGSSTFRPGAVLVPILKTLNLTDAQKTDIQAVVQAHRHAIQAARENQDPTALRAEMRDVVRQVAAILTPEQRDHAKEAIKAALGERAVSPAPAP